MKLNITYRPLCTANIWHAYYLHPVNDNGQDWIDPVGRPNALQTSALENLASSVLSSGDYTILNDLSITPTLQTAAFMNRMKMAFRLQKTGFVIWIRAQKEDSGGYRPLIPINADFKLDFLISARNPDFFNFTAINLPLGRHSIYYFSNLAQNQDGTNSLLLNANARGLTPPQNYASSDDLLPVGREIIGNDISHLNVRLVFSNPLLQFETRFEKPEAGAETGTYTPPLSRLPSGRYDLKAFAESGEEMPDLRESIYWNRGDIPPDALGVIELYHLSGANLGEYAFLGANGQLRGPTYTLWWQNRSTYWRYLFNKDQPLPGTSNPDCQVKLEEPGNPAKLITKEKHPLLSRYRQISFYARNNSNNGEVLLPNPGPARIYPEAAEVYSEIYMGDIDLDKIN